MVGNSNTDTSFIWEDGISAGRSMAKALPFTDQPLQSAPGLGDPTGTKLMHPYATTSLQFESNFWMGNATSALFCSSPSQLQVWSGFPRGKAACLRAAFGRRLFLGFLLAHNTAVSNHLRG